MNLIRITRSFCTWYQITCRTFVGFQAFVAAYVSVFYPDPQVAMLLKRMGTLHEPFAWIMMVAASVMMLEALWTRFNLLRSRHILFLLMGFFWAIVGYSVFHSEGAALLVKTMVVSNFVFCIIISLVDAFERRVERYLNYSDEQILRSIEQES